MKPLIFTKEIERGRLVLPLCELSIYTSAVCVSTTILQNFPATHMTILVVDYDMLLKELEDKFPVFFIGIDKKN